MQTKRIKDIDYYETWKGQKELEKIVNNRILVRPKTNYFTISIISLLIILLTTLFIVFLVKYEMKTYLKIIYIIVYIFSFFEILLRFLFIKIIECYQHYAKEETRRRCMCIPSCSEYSIAVLKKYLLIKALLKIRKRLYVTCKGEMYLIDSP